MIRAVPLQGDILRRTLAFMFIEQSDRGTLYYARSTTDAFTSSPGWYPGGDLFDESVDGSPIKDGWELVTVTLDREVAAALADVILTETTGVAPSDARALRQDLMHERDRRDKLEDAMIRLATR